VTYSSNFVSTDLGATTAGPASVTPNPVMGYPYIITRAYEMAFSNYPTSSSSEMFELGEAAITLDLEINIEEDTSTSCDFAIAQTYITWSYVGTDPTVSTDPVSFDEATAIVTIATSNSVFVGNNYIY